MGTVTMIFLLYHLINLLIDIVALIIFFVNENNQLSKFNKVVPISHDYQNNVVGGTQIMDRL